MATPRITPSVKSQVGVSTGLDYAGEALALIGAGGLRLSATGQIISCFGVIDALLGRSHQSLLNNLNISAVEPLAPVYEVLSARLGAGMSNILARDVSIGLSSGLDKADITLSRANDGEGFILILQSRGTAVPASQEQHRSGAARTIAGLAAMLAHEVKNPLAGIRGAAQLAARAMPQEKRHLSDLIIREVDRIGTLVDGMDIYAVPPGEEARPVNIHEVLNHVTALLKLEEGAGVRIKRIFDPSLPPVAGRFEALVQIFLNLIKNAVQVLDQTGLGGSVTISTKYQHGLFVRNDEGRSRRLPIEVTISDTGPGISEDIIDHIFDPFVTTRQAGTGLGLAMVARLIEDLGARVSVKNREAGGAEFKIYLPFFEETTEALKQSEETGG